MVWKIPVPFHAAGENLGKSLQRRIRRTKKRPDSNCQGRYRKAIYRFIA